VQIDPLPLIKLRGAAAYVRRGGDRIDCCNGWREERKDGNENQPR